MSIRQDVHNLRLFIVNINENDATLGPNRPLEMPFKLNYKSHKILPTFVFPVLKSFLNSLFSYI